MKRDSLQDQAMFMGDALRMRGYSVPEALTVVGMLATALICCDPTVKGRAHVLAGFKRTLEKSVRDRGGE